MSAFADGPEPGSILPAHERLIDGSRVKPGMAVCEVESRCVT